VPQAKLRVIIFDIGRVLVRVDVGRAMPGLAVGLSLSAAELWSTIEKDPRWLDWQEGRITPRDWHLHLTRRLGSSLTFEQFVETWNLALDPKPIQDITLFQKLSRRYRLGLLSNTDPIHVAHMEHNYDFFPFFPVRVYSCSVGASKPNPFIYRETLRACKAQAGEALYIDDVAEYVEAARHLGLAGIHYQSPTQLANELERRGVKLE
jgi:putative hydrolase of the HAD superfamily